MRATAVVLCCAIAAYCAVTAVQIGSYERAEEIVFAQDAPSAGDAERAQSAIDRAQVLNPAAEPDLVEGQLRFETGREAEGQSLIEAVTRREPDNIEAWDRLAGVALERDADAFARAQRELRRLAPPLERP